MGLNPQAVANALTEGVGIAIDSTKVWHWYLEKPNRGSEQWLTTDKLNWSYGTIPFEIDYSGDWKSSWTPKEEPARKNAFSADEVHKIIGAVNTRETLPCPDHAEKVEVIQIPKQKNMTVNDIAEEVSKIALELVLTKLHKGSK